LTSRGISAPSAAILKAEPVRWASTRREKGMLALSFLPGSVILAFSSSLLSGPFHK
jgi:hypothetical protein